MLNAKWITKNQNTRLYQIPLPIIGLTGGIATGKSTVAEFLRTNNVPVIDADKLVKNIYQKKDTVEFIKNNFPEAVENNSIIFTRLRKLAFTNPSIKKQLEDYIYALLPGEFATAFKALPPSPYIVYDVPLLFEKGLDQFLDTTICVYAPREIQIERLMKRDGVDQSLAEKILDQQMNIEDKKNKANLIINNTQNKDQLEAECKKVLAQLVI